MKTLNQLYIESGSDLPFSKFRKEVEKSHNLVRRSTPQGRRWVIDEAPLIPRELESPAHPGYALQEDVWRHFSPHTTLRMFTENFPVKHVRLVVSYNPLKRRNFYPLEAIHRDSPIKPAKPQSPKPDSIPYRKSYLQHALLHLQNEPQFTRKRLYLFYTQKMPQRPPLEHFPRLSTYYLTPEGLKAILRKNRWPL